MKRSKLMIHLATTHSIPDQTPAVLKTEQNTVPKEEFLDQFAHVSDQSISQHFTTSELVKPFTESVQKDQDISDSLQASTQQNSVTTSDVVQPITESIHKDYFDKFSNVSDNLLATTSIQKTPITIPDIVQPITEPTLLSQYSYNIINQESSTKIKLRKKLKLPYNEKNSSDEEENFWGETDSDNYVPSSDESTSSENSGNSAENKENPVLKSPLLPHKKGKKRQRQPEKWKKTQAKLLKNIGKSYRSRTGKVVKERVMGPPCPSRCTLKCSSKFSDDRRTHFFHEYWKLATLQRQRDFLASCVAPLELKYRRVGSEQPRKPNCAFYLWDNGTKNRVCKTFLINTFGITERTMRTIVQARAINSGVIPEDKRGRHGNHKKIDEEIIESVKKHIDSVPRIESHYQRQNTSREFIPGELTISEMHRSYTKERNEMGKPAANYDLYSRIFNNDFNIGFFFPKKDQCDICEGYQNATGEDKKRLENDYIDHQEEKKLSRAEKDADKKKSKEEGSNMVFAVYDLPVPMGQSSAFFYKSRLNCFNFTVTDISNDNTVCFFWHEGLGHRGAVEIGSCVLMFIEEIAISRPGADIVFYSDNCCGQQKNRFVFAMYLYAVETLPINSITHKYLIRGHTQNEGDTIHSIIEKSVKRAKKAGPIYVPDQLVTLIRNSKKKGNPLHVKELGFRDFVDLKQLNHDIGFNCQKNNNGEQIKVSEIKIIRFDKDSDVYFYKTSYKEAEWKQAKRRNIGTRRSSEAKNINNILKKPAYNAKIPIAENKRIDLQSLLTSNIIPNYYESFFNSLV